MPLSPELCRREHVVWSGVPGVLRVTPRGVYSALASGPRWNSVGLQPRGCWRRVSLGFSSHRGSLLKGVLARPKPRFSASSHCVIGISKCPVLLLVCADTAWVASPLVFPSAGRHRRRADLLTSGDFEVGTPSDAIFSSASDFEAHVYVEIAYYCLAFGTDSPYSSCRR